MKTTWRKLLVSEIEGRGDSVDDLVCTLSSEELDEEFYSGFGSINGKPFTAWTENWVYFPSDYDGSENVASAPRNPCDHATDHVGGGG